MPCHLCHLSKVYGSVDGDQRGRARRGAKASRIEPYLLLTRALALVMWLLMGASQAIVSTASPACLQVESRGS